MAVSFFSVKKAQFRAIFYRKKRHSKTHPWYIVGLNWCFYVKIQPKISTYSPFCHPIVFASSQGDFLKKIISTQISAKNVIFFWKKYFLAGNRPNRSSMGLKWWEMFKFYVSVTKTPQKKRHCGKSPLSFFSVKSDCLFFR